MHRSTVQKFLKLKSIPLRRRSSLDHYNIDFFNNYTEESCYWAGFILAEGHFRKKNDVLHIKLSYEDKERLEVFLSHIGAKRKVRDYKHTYRNTKYSVVDICGKWYLNSINRNFGFTREKYFTCLPWNFLGADMLAHFVRGFFDGDGSISIPNKTKVCMINFAGEREWLEPLSKYLSELLDIHLKSGNKFAPYVPNKNGIAGLICYSGKNAMKIFDWMYDRSGLHMKRKYDKFMNYKINHESKC